MLSLRMVVAPSWSASFIPASSHSRATSSRMVSGLTLITATRLRFAIGEIYRLSSESQLCSRVARGDACVNFGLDALRRSHRAGVRVVQRLQLAGAMDAHRAGNLPHGRAPPVLVH